MSADGSTWTTVGSTTISLPASADVGTHRHEPRHVAAQHVDVRSGRRQCGDRRHSAGNALFAGAGQRRDRRRHEPDAHLEFVGRHDLRREVRHDQSAAAGDDRSSGRVVHAGDTAQSARRTSGRSSRTTAPARRPVRSGRSRRGARASPTNIVIYASDIPAAGRHGSWTTGVRRRRRRNNIEADHAGRRRREHGTDPLASPTDYVDVTFTANAGMPYTLWMRVQGAEQLEVQRLALRAVLRCAGERLAASTRLNTTSGLAGESRHRQHRRQPQRLGLGQRRLLALASRRR